MSLDIAIIFKEPRLLNYFIEHPYTYSYLSDKDLSDYTQEECWWVNITHNLGELANHIPVGDGHTLYEVCWLPEEHGWETTDDVLPLLIEGLQYAIAHRKELLQYNAPNGWGTYAGFMKFLLNYKEACEDNPNCKIKTDK